MQLKRNFDRSNLLSCTAQLCSRSSWEDTLDGKNSLGSTMTTLPHSNGHQDRLAISTESSLLEHSIKLFCHKQVLLSEVPCSEQCSDITR
jgi:hypothetical protein